MINIPDMDSFLFVTCEIIQCYGYVSLVDIVDKVALLHIIDTIDH